MIAAADILSLLLKFGPPAFDMIRGLAAIWTKPTLTLEEVNAFCDLGQKATADYEAEARLKLIALGEIPKA